VTSRRLKPLVWPLALLIAAGLTALVADATTRSVETVTLYGIVKMVSDLVLLIGVVWLVVALFRVVKPAAPRA
jgi:membrane-bound ClpP family serine protease